MVSRASKLLTLNTSDGKVLISLLCKWSKRSALRPLNDPLRTVDSLLSSKIKIDMPVRPTNESTGSSVSTLKRRSKRVTPLKPAKSRARICVKPSRKSEKTPVTSAKSATSVTSLHVCDAVSVPAS